MKAVHALALLLPFACATPAVRPEPVVAPTAAPAAEVVQPVAPATRPYDQPQIAALRTQASAHVKRQYELYWKNWTEGADLDLATTYTDGDTLFSLASLEKIRAAREASTDDAARALRALEGYVAGEIVAREMAAHSAKLEKAEAAAQLEIAGQRYPLHDLDRLLAAEPAAATRAKLAAAEGPALDALAPLVDEKLAKADAVAKSLGYASYTALGALLRDFEPAGLERLAQEVLTATEPAWRRTMTRLAKTELALPLAKVKRSDVPRLLRATTPPAAFSEASEVTTAQALLRALGVDLTGAPGLTVNAAAVPRKNSRPICLPVEVPLDVRLSVRPAGGTEGLRAVVRELGHAAEYLHATRPEWEFQQLGGAAIVEAFADLFAGIVETPAWLESTAKLSADVARPWATSVAARRLFRLRRSAALVLFELRLHAGTSGAPPDEDYRALFSRAFGFELTAVDGKRWRLAHDDFFAAADDLRAWTLAAQLRAHLESEFGGSWFKDVRTGALLKPLWAEGTRLTPEEIAQRLDGGTLDARGLAKLFEERLP